MNRSRRVVVAVAASVGLIASGAAASAQEAPPPVLLGRRATTSRTCRRPLRSACRRRWRPRSAARRPLVDRYLDERAKLSGGKRPELTARELHSTLNLKEPAAYAKEGAAPNGADYLHLDAADLKSLRFAGEREVIAPSGESQDPTAAVDNLGETPTAGEVGGW